jgi:hypothetical protein
LIKARWITFKEARNMNTNPLPNHAISSGTINVLKNRGLKTLKVFMDGIYEMLVKV